MPLARKGSDHRRPVGAGMVRSPASNWYQITPSAYTSSRGSGLFPRICWGDA